jgi:hypothetical protein
VDLDLRLRFPFVRFHLGCGFSPGDQATLGRDTYGKRLGTLCPGGPLRTVKAGTTDASKWLGVSENEA